MPNSRNQRSQKGQADRPRPEAFAQAQADIKGKGYTGLFSRDEVNAMILERAWYYEEAFRAQEAEKAAKQIKVDTRNLGKPGHSR